MRWRRKRGVTLLEVLTAIFITGVGLLALLTLFPLGALSMARAVKGDRAAAVAASAVALSQEGAALLSRTEDLIAESLANGPDAQKTAELRADYEELDGKAADLQADLLQLRKLVSGQKVQKKIDQLLLQIRAIRSSLQTLAKLLAVLESLNTK
jgi:prepilin-type N-terminal cleavage/methylation domain-containing protein